MAAEVPQDLILEIVKLLPVKALLRFRCISKSLCSSVDNPVFIKWHLSRNSDHRTIITFQEYDLNFDVVNPNIPINVLDIDDDLLIPQELRAGNLYDLSYSNKVYAHCNGLVLIAEEKGCFNMVVWNPSTRKCRELPLLLMRIMKSNPLIKSLGFWYDSSEDDYKVIQLREWWRDCFYNEPYYYEIWILGLRSGYWRKIKKFPYKWSNYYIVHEEYCRNVIVDGVFYFKCRTHAIYALDLAKETLSTISFPDRNYDGLLQYDRILLQVLEGCLCVSLFNDRGNNKLFEFFARKKNDVDGEFYWTKLFSIINDSYQKVPSASEDFYIFRYGEILGFSKDRDKIYFLDYKHQLYSYDSKRKTSKRLYVIGGRCFVLRVWFGSTRKKKKNKVLSSTFCNN